ncbi:MAG: hydrogenase maturation nickel metallochaperone HypA [Clostridiales bacterium]|nr:hydrogenase maturation nickel metallochaperone HypA [Clostridiales bacterium]
MHELSIAKRIINAAMSRLPEDFDGRVIEVNITVGRMLGYEKEWIIRYFDKFVKDTPLEGAELTVENQPVSFRCLDCDMLIFPNYKDSDLFCTKCNGRNLKLEGGRDCRVNYITTEMKEND